MNYAIDEMSIVHFVNFFIIGLLVKNNYLFAFLLGVIWEIFEFLVVNHIYFRKLLIKYWPIPKRLWEEKNKYNKILDLAFNMLGYYFGSNIKN